MTSSPVSALVRATIFVQHLDRAATFYNALGLNEVYFEGTLEDASACSLLGLEIIRPFDIKILKRPGPNFGMVGLFALPDDCKAERLPTPCGPVRVGEVALIFYVADLTRTLLDLGNAGATWMRDPEMFVLPHRAQREVCVRDCDGVLLNLVETDPDQQFRELPELSYQP
jgi:catechol 2,3-dioxygenase-like lactoylglutathione lyase family enzyme